MSELLHPDLPSRDLVRSLVMEALEQLGGEARREEIVDRAVEIGGFTEAQLSVPPPPSHLRYGSLISYWLSWALSENKKRGFLENPSREVWRLSGRPWD